jgi:dethiobiotin synthetase
VTRGIGRGIFITGTDTDVGKTFVSRLLAEGFASACPVHYLKPVQTGCMRDASGALAAPDFDYIVASGVIADQPPGDSVPYRFEPACSPHLAAARAGVTISIDRIRDACSRLADRASVTLVEGAGGVLVPLGPGIVMADLMLHLGLPVIVVTEPRIGTINHTLLTLEALDRRAIPVAGVVLNNIHAMAENYIYHDIVRVIRGQARTAEFLELPHDAVCDDRVKEFCNALIKRL